MPAQKTQQTNGNPTPQIAWAMLVLPPTLCTSVGYSGLADGVITGTEIAWRLPTVTVPIWDLDQLTNQEGS